MTAEPFFSPSATTCALPHRPSSRTSAPQATPYGLEGYRVALLRRRQRLLAAGMVLGILLLAALLASTIRDSANVTPFGGTGNTIQLDIPEKQRAKPTTLTVSPGRTTVLDKPIQPEARPAPRQNQAEQDRGTGLNWLGLLTNILPPFAAVVVSWRMGRKRFLTGLEQVNLGVYKGALPFELHAAEHKRFVFTKRMAYGALFGYACRAEGGLLSRTRFQRVR